MREPITITADLTNFAADKLLMGQKVEASALRVTASNDGYQITGDVKINGTPAAIDLSKKKGRRWMPICDCRRCSTKPRAAGSASISAAPSPARSRSRLTARIGDDGKDAPMSVDADLTPVKIDNLLPGWVKAAGKPAHATYTLIKTGQVSALRRPYHRRVGRAT